MPRGMFSEAVVGGPVLKVNNRMYIEGDSEVFGFAINVRLHF